MGSRACEQTVAAESDNESVGDSPARGGLNKALELTVNSARGEKSHSGEVHADTDSEFCVAIPQIKEWFEGRYANTAGCRS